MSTELTRSYLKKESQEFDLETIFILKLDGRSLNDLGCIGMCISLIHLNLSYNNLRSVMALRTLNQLQTLNVSVNQLSALSGLEQLESLRRLNACGNHLSNIDSLLPLTKVKTLRSLTLKDKLFTNPLLNCSENEDNVRSNIIQMLTQIHILDGEILTGEGKDFHKTCSEIKILAEQYSDLDQRSYLSQQLSFTPQACYLHIGIEKNKLYDSACAVATECEALSKKINEKLDVNS